MEYIVAKEKVVKYIGISKKTEFEVRKKLQTLDVQSKDKEKIIEDLKELEYIDDKLYVTLFIKQNIKALKYSKYEIKYKLQSKGIQKDEIDKQLCLLDNNNYEAKVIKILVQSKLKSQDEKKQKEYLYRRGFRLEGFDINE